MSKKVMAVLVAFLFTSAAFAVDEQGASHNTIATAQRLVIGADRGVTVNGALGNRLRRESVIHDVDFYSFEGTEGDVVNIDIDDGTKAPGSDQRSVDTVIALFGPCATSMAPLCAQEDDRATDSGSIGRLDARIGQPGQPDYRLPRSGIWTVGVVSSPWKFRRDESLIRTSTAAPTNGTYTLIISGVTPNILQINIEIKPGSGESAPINPKSKGSIPVALLSHDDFNAMTVDYESLTFGPNGTEAGLPRCARQGEDIDGYGRLDLVCHFDMQAAGFEPGDSTGVVKGRTTSQAGGRAFEGRGLINIVGVGKKAD